MVRDISKGIIHTENEGLIHRKSIDGNNGLVKFSAEELQAGYQSTIKKVYQDEIKYDRKNNEYA